MAFVLRHIAAIAAGCLISISAPAPAQASDTSAQQIKGAALKALFYDKTVIAEYNGFKGNKAEKFTEYHNPDGTTIYDEAGENELAGTWQMVGDDKICFRYPGITDMRGTHCFFIFKQDTCYYNFTLANMGLKGPRNWDHWTSRFVVKGTRGTCAAPVG